MKLKYIKEPESKLIADLQKGWEIRDNGVKIKLVNTLGITKFEYNTLEEFSKEWKTLKEPLLQGKLRESLKLWADYQGVKKLKYIKGGTFSLFSYVNEKLGFNINFEINTVLFDLDEKEYDLTDLVGE